MCNDLFSKDFLKQKKFIGASLKQKRGNNWNNGWFQTTAIFCWNWVWRQICTGLSIYFECQIMCFNWRAWSLLPSPKWKWYTFCKRNIDKITYFQKMCISKGKVTINETIDDFRVQLFVQMRYEHKL